MIAAHRLKATRPDACQVCGVETEDLDWCAVRDSETDEPGPRKWLCGDCLTGPMLPLELEAFARSGTSNLGAAQKYEISSCHAHGPDGDRALAKRRRVG
jgi:hypothetical protein